MLCYQVFLFVVTEAYKHSKKNFPSFLAGTPQFDISWMQPCSPILKDFSKLYIYGAPTFLLFLVLMTPLPAPTPPVPPVVRGQLALIELVPGPSLITGAGTHRPVLSSQQTVKLGA